MNDKKRAVMVGVVGVVGVHVRVKWWCAEFKVVNTCHDLSCLVQYFALLLFVRGACICTNLHMQVERPELDPVISDSSHFGYSCYVF